MKKTRTTILWVVLSATLAVATMHAAEKRTIKGYIIDSACTFIKDLKKPISRDCAVSCAKAGSPLVIQAEDGTIYLPISAQMPAGSQNDKLLPFAGQLVTVNGAVYEKGGARAIVIDKIERAAP